LYISIVIRQIVHTDNGLVLLTDWQWQTQPLVREGAPYGQDFNFSIKNKYLVMSPRRGSTPRLTVSHSVTLTLTSITHISALVKKTLLQRVYFIHQQSSVSNTSHYCSSFAGQPVSLPAPAIPTAVASSFIQLPPTHATKRLQGRLAGCKGEHGAAARKPLHWLAHRKDGLTETNGPFQGLQSHWHHKDMLPLSFPTHPWYSNSYKHLL
jgi:hypothetical protein